MSLTRTLPVPDGLEGERVDPALARMFGFSRTKAAELRRGAVQLDGAPAGKSDRVQRRRVARGRAARRRPGRPVVAEPVDGMAIVHDDEDIVVVDKPVGVAAHPSPGWTGPTVVGGLAAAGFRISTSGAAERQGVVHRLDVGTSGLMVVAKSERAYSVLKQAFRERTVDKRYHALVQGHPDPLERHDRRADRPAPGARLQVGGRRRRQGQHHPLRDARGLPRRQRCWRSSWRRAGPTRSACTSPRSATRASATSPTAPTRRSPRGSA